MKLAKFSAVAIYSWQNTLWCILHITIHKTSTVANLQSSPCKQHTMTYTQYSSQQSQLQLQLVHIHSVLLITYISRKLHQKTLLSSMLSMPTL